jgi:hypothetical protein
MATCAVHQQIIRAKEPTIATSCRGKNPISTASRNDPVSLSTAMDRGGDQVVAGHRLQNLAQVDDEGVVRLQPCSSSAVVAFLGGNGWVSAPESARSRLATMDEQPVSQDTQLSLG